MADERPEARLAAAPVNLFRQRGALERERHLRGERVQRGADCLGRRCAPGDDEQPALALRRREIEHEDAVVVARQLERGERLGTQPHDVTLAGGVEQHRLDGPVRLDRAHQGHELGPGQRSRSAQRHLVDLLAARGGDQVRP